MATGMIALLDDVAAIAKLAASSLDDVGAQTAKASAKAAGVIIDDTAVAPTYVAGLSPTRELPIIGRIAFGSLRNKLLFLLPICLLLGYFAPWMITPMLMIGGGYLSLEGVEKLHEAFSAHQINDRGSDPSAMNPRQLEDQKVAAAIRTDFILSAEIMALTLAGVATSTVAEQALVLAAVGILITSLVYGFVAVIVKADDLGLHLADSVSRPIRLVGRGLVKGTPILLQVLTIVGTAAMLWVGGSIIIHGLAEFGFHGPEHQIAYVTALVQQAISFTPAVTGWIATSLMQAALGIVVGAAVLIVVGLTKRATANAT